MPVEFVLGPKLIGGYLVNPCQKRLLQCKPPIFSQSVNFDHLSTLNLKGVRIFIEIILEIYISIETEDSLNYSKSLGL